jgi:hypothetical protein
MNRAGRLVNKGIFGVAKGVDFWHDSVMKKTRRLVDEYQYPGFRPSSKIKGVYGDSNAVMIRLVRRQKKRHVDVAERVRATFMIIKPRGFETCPVAISGFIWPWRFGGWIAGSVAK